MFIFQIAWGGSVSLPRHFICEWLGVLKRTLHQLSSLFVVGLGDGYSCRSSTPVRFELGIVAILHSLDAKCVLAHDELFPFIPGFIPVFG